MATEASQSAKGIFRGYRSDGQWPQPFVPAGHQRWYWQAIGRRTVFIRRTALPICDAFALFLTALLAGPGWPALGYGAAVLVFLKFNGRQRLRICLRLSDEVAGLASAAILPIPLFLFFVNPQALARLAVLSGVLLMTIRLALYAVLRIANRRRWLVERALIVGSGTLGAEIEEALREHPELGLEPVGFVDSVDSTVPGRIPSLPLLGAVPKLPDLVLAYDVHRIIVASPDDNDSEVVSVLRAGGQLTAEVCVVPRMRELAPAVPASCQDDIWGIPVIPLRRPGFRLSSRVVKRAFDLVVGTILLLFAPLIALLMGGVVLTCGRPALFRQARVTRSGRLMNITKLRTVARTDADGRWTVSPEDCSALGRWLRATHLDELPQLVNVIRGDMSLVGPRPERPYFTSQFSELVPRYQDRLRANGGMTGWAQVHDLTGDTSIHERARFDNNYIDHWSLWLDLVILVRTLTEPLSGIRKKQ
jgi:exopolysaccharide biosynthesis polyprenyl glycosylphosphotransferase